MAKKLGIWYDEEGDYLEVLFDEKEGLQSLKVRAICEQLLLQKPIDQMKARPAFS